MDFNKAIESFWTTFKPQITPLIRGGVKVIAGILGGWGALKSPGSQEQFIELGTAIALGAIAQGWSWWVASGQDLVKNQVLVYEAKVRAQADKIRQHNIAPVTVNEITQNSVLDKAQVLNVIGTMPPSVQANIAGMTGSGVKAALVLALLLGTMAWPGDASAQGIKLKTPAQIEQDIQSLNAKIDGLTAKVNSTVTSTVKNGVATVTGTSSSAAVPCDFNMLLKLTPANLIPTIKECISNQNSTIAADMARALESAQNFKNVDQDAVNCLTPGLALVKAGIQVPAVPAVAAQPAIPAVPAQAAIPETPTSPAVPAVPAQAAVPAVVGVDAVPAQDPGVFLLFQKYREFTLAGALTSCQTWVNEPVQATAAAGVGAVAGVAGAALLVPK